MKNMKNKKYFAEPKLSVLGGVEEITLQGNGVNDGVSGGPGAGPGNGGGNSGSNFNNGQGGGGGAANGKAPGAFDGNSQNTGGGMVS